MGVLRLAILFASIGQTVKTPDTVLRAGCDGSDEEVAKLPAGAPVTIRFAISGCYKVTVDVGGKLVDGYLLPSAIDNAAGFEDERRNARSVVQAINPGALQIAAASPGGAKLAALLKANQPAQALQAAQADLIKFPRNPDLLAFAGIAAYKADELPKAIGYLRDSLAARPDASIERFLKNVERENAESAGSAKLVSTRFLLRYDARLIAADDARALIGVLEQEYSRVAGPLGCRVDDKLVAILLTREAYLKTTDAAEWSGGSFDGRMKVAVIEKPIGERTRRTLAHEMVHACLASTGEWPAWLHEGLAQKYSGEVRPDAWRERVHQMAKGGQLPHLERMSQTWSRMSNDHAAIAYTMALEAVNTIFAAYGEQGVSNLIRNPAWLPQLSADLDRRLAAQ